MAVVEMVAVVCNSPSDDRLQMRSVVVAMGIIFMETRARRSDSRPGAGRKTDVGLNRRH